MTNSLGTTPEKYGFEGVTPAAEAEAEAPQAKTEKSSDPADPLPSGTLVMVSIPGQTYRETVTWA